MLGSLQCQRPYSIQYMLCMMHKAVSACRQVRGTIPCWHLHFPPPPPPPPCWLRPQGSLDAMITSFSSVMHSRVICCSWQLQCGYLSAATIMPCLWDLNFLVSVVSCCRLQQCRDSSCDSSCTGSFGEAFAAVSSIPPPSLCGHFDVVCNSLSPFRQPKHKGSAVVCW